MACCKVEFTWFALPLTLRMAFPTLPQRFKPENAGVARPQGFASWGQISGLEEVSRQGIAWAQRSLVCARGGRAKRTALHAANVARDPLITVVSGSRPEARGRRMIFLHQRRNALGPLAGEPAFDIAY